MGMGEERDIELKEGHGCVVHTDGITVAGKNCDEVIKTLKELKKMDE